MNLKDEHRGLLTDRSHRTYVFPHHNMTASYPGLNLVRVTNRHARPARIQPCVQLYEYAPRIALLTAVFTQLTSHLTGIQSSPMDASGHVLDTQTILTILSPPLTYAMMFVL